MSTVYLVCCSGTAVNYGPDTYCTLKYVHRFAAVFMKFRIVNDLVFVCENRILKSIGSDGCIIASLYTRSESEFVVSLESKTVLDKKSHVARLVHTVRLFGYMIVIHR